MYCMIYMTYGDLIWLFWSETIPNNRTNPSLNPKIIRPPSSLPPPPRTEGDPVDALSIFPLAVETLPLLMITLPFSMPTAMAGIRFSREFFDDLSYKLDSVAGIAGSLSCFRIWLRLNMMFSLHSTCSFPNCPPKSGIATIKVYLILMYIRAIDK